MEEPKQNKDCKWVEVFYNWDSSKVIKTLCHLTPESKRINWCADCPGCKHYVKNDDEQ